MSTHDHKFDDLGDGSDRNESAHDSGEFTRAFGGKSGPANQNDPEAEGGPAPGSLTQLLGGKSKTTLPAPADKRYQPSAAPNPPGPQPVDSFTTAFDGLNAFTRDPANIDESNVPADVHPRPVSSSGPAGSFARLFGSGEGVLTPTGGEEPHWPSADGDPKPPPGSSPDIEPGGFTQAFSSPSASQSRPPSSFTANFGTPPPSVQEPFPPSKPPSYRRPDDTLPQYRVEPTLPSVPQRPPASGGGFTRLIDPSRGEPAPVPEPTRPSHRSLNTESSLLDLDFARRSPVSESGATVVLNPGKQSEPEVVRPLGKSEYTVVVERSKLRPPIDVSGSGGAPHGVGATTIPPSPPQPQQFTPPAPLAWTPPAAAAPWQAPVTPPPVPQMPAVAVPALSSQPPTLGDKLVSFLPFMLALTVINFLGLLAVLIILFATRK